MLITSTSLIILIGIFSSTSHNKLQSNSPSIEIIQCGKDFKKLGKVPNINLKTFPSHVSYVTFTKSHMSVKCITFNIYGSDLEFHYRVYRLTNI